MLNLLKLDRSILTLFKKIGPGLLYAAAAVGVSHLVQSTRAGANYGWIMVAIVFLANLVKYPFFLIGPLYTYHKGKTILEGFQKLGKWSLWLYLLTTLATLFTTVAVISLICSSLISSIFHFNYPLWFISLTLILIVIYLVYFGKFKQLSAIIKLIILLLSVSSIVALFLAFNSAENFSVFESSFSIFNRIDILFLISLIGWMPAPLDIIIWQSEWMTEQKKIRAFTLKGTLFDFNVGYWGTTFLAVVFTSLGVLVLHNSKIPLEVSASGFIAQLIHLYTSTIGDYAYPFIAFAAIATMLSTLITVIDAYTRVIPKVSSMLFDLNDSNYNIISKINLLLIVSMSVLILKFGLNSLTNLIDLATSISFLTAPMLATLYLLLLRKTPITDRNKRQYLFISSIIGLIFLVIFGAIYIYYTFL